MHDDSRPHRHGQVVLHVTVIMVPVAAAASIEEDPIGSVLEMDRHLLVVAGHVDAGLGSAPTGDGDLAGDDAQIHDPARIGEGNRGVDRWLVAIVAKRRVPISGRE